MTNEFELICRDAIEKFGIKTQMMVACEECAELIQAISKVYRQNPGYLVKSNLLNNLIIEIVDTEIMLEQLKIIIPEIAADNLMQDKKHINKKLKAIKLEKIERLKRMLQED